MYFIAVYLYVTDCDSYFERSLFVVGEIGGNDYNYAAIAGNITQLQATVPPVVEAIKTAINVILYQTWLITV